MSRRLLLRLLARAPATDHVPDAELLRRFLASNDPAAFELVVRRHAGAVWAAVSRALRNEADAEDAFQATFLALIRRAGAVRSACVGGWLHRVAVNAALKQRERAARLSPTEPAQLDALPASAPEEPEADRAAIHEELARLPERERLPVVLCDLEGLSHAEAAERLGWPVGTVSGRLSRARARLRDRLARRGLTPASVILPAAIAPPHLIPGAVSLVSGTASPAVISLTEGVLAMTSTSWKWVVFAVVSVGALGAGSVLAFGPGAGLVLRPNAIPAPAQVAADNNPVKGAPADKDWILDTSPEQRKKDTSAIPPSAFPELTPPEEAEPNGNPPIMSRSEQFDKKCPRLAGERKITIDPTDGTLRKLLKARLNRGVLEMLRIREAVNLQVWNPAYLGRMIECLNDMRGVVIELWTGQPKELIPWLEELVVMAKEFERFMQLRVQHGANSPQDLDAVVRHRLAAEAALWEVKKGR